RLFDDAGNADAVRHQEQRAAQHQVDQRHAEDDDARAHALLLRSILRSTITATAIATRVAMVRPALYGRAASNAARMPATAAAVWAPGVRSFCTTMPMKVAMAANSSPSSSSPLICEPTAMPIKVQQFQ